MNGLKLIEHFLLKFGYKDISKIYSHWSSHGDSFLFDERNGDRIVLCYTLEQGKLAYGESYITGMEFVPP